MASSFESGLLVVKIALLFIALAWPPGYLFLCSLRFPSEKSLFQGLFLPAILGIPIISLVYFAFRIFHVESFFFLIPWGFVAASIAVFFRLRSRSPIPAGSTVDWKAFLFFVVLYATFMLIFYSFAKRIHFDNLGGFIIGDGAFDDRIWGVCVTAELQHRVPPLLPIYAGYKLQYHYLADLFIELLYRMSGTQMRIFDFYYKFTSPILILWLIGTLISVFNSYFKRFSWTVLAVLLIVLVPPQTVFFYKHHYTLTVLFFSTAFFFLLQQYFLNQKPAYGWAAFTLLGFLPLYDAIIGAVALGAVIAYAVLDSILKKRWCPILNYCIFAVALSAFCMLALLGWSHSPTSTFGVGKGVFLEVAKTRFRNITRLLEVFLYFTLSQGNLYHEIVRNSVLCLSRFCAFFVTLFYPLADSPIRYYFLAFPAVFAAFRRPERLKEVNTLVAWMLLLAFCVSTFIIYKPSGPPGAVLDRALSFLAIFLMPLTVAAIFDLWVSKRIWGRTLLIGMAVVYLVLPSMRADAFLFKPGYYAYIDRASMEVFDFIRNQTDPCSIILHPFHDDPIYKVGEPPLKPAWLFQGHYFFMTAIGERQTVFEGAVTSTTYFMGDLTYADAVRRLWEVDHFYQTDDTVWARGFLKKYHVSHVWVLKDKPLRFKYEGLLSPVFKNEKNTLYAVVRT